MLSTKFASKRAVVLLAVLLAFACVASADTVYNVSGTFQLSSSSNPFTGPLNGGSFSGTFSATLPTTGFQTFSTFNLSLYNSSSALAFTLSNSNSGDFADIAVETSNCAISSTTTGPCDIFLFSNSSGTDFLELGTPQNFTGGSVSTGYVVSGAFESFAGDGGNTDSTDSVVASGSIDPAPEPGTFVLLGLGLLAGFWIERKRLLA